MRRWISSGAITLSLIACAFFLPLWNQTGNSGVKTAASQMNVSVVRITKRIPTRKVQQRQVSEKPKRNPQDVIRRISETDVSLHEEELPVEEVQEESMETENFDELVEIAQNDDSVGVGKETIENYKSYALSRIASKKSYPYAARSRGQQGRVKLKVVIESDGSVRCAEIVRESEHSLLNEASLAAVKKAAPFKKMPHGMKRQEYVFVIDYSLE